MNMGSFGIATLFLFVLLGSMAGFLAGLLGIGGGIILVPLFLWAFKVSGFAPEILVHTAFGTSLAIIIPTAFSSTLGHRKRGNVDWHQVGYLCMGGVLGALCGAWLASLLSGNWLKGLFGIMQILVALKLLIFHPRLPPVFNESISPRALLAVGVAGGLFSAFFGVGGGVVAVPLMVIVLSFPIHLAVGNSSALIVVSSLTGAVSYLLHGLHVEFLPPFSVGYVNFLVLLLVAPFTIIMARLGVRIASRTSHD
ncbi:MAG: sulfite exporter TauE/SafE family protein, partial [Gammaproteobacteria bacterium]|nr:sulfite exporter TauE/SafE family protein [Gammaproteobacteria bacterium]